MTLTYFLGKRKTTLNELISGMKETNFRDCFKQYGVSLSFEEESQILFILSHSSNSTNSEEVKLIEIENVVQECEDRRSSKNKKPTSSKKNPKQ